MTAIPYWSDEAEVGSRPRFAPSVPGHPMDSHGRSSVCRGVVHRSGGDGPGQVIGLRAQPLRLDSELLVTHRAVANHCAAIYSGALARFSVAYDSNARDHRRDDSGDPGRTAAGP